MTYNQRKQLFWGSFVALIIVIATIALSGCASRVDIPTTEGKVQASLIEAENALLSVSEVVLDYIDAGIIEKGSKRHNDVKAAIKKASDALDKAWAAYSIGDLDKALKDAKNARTLYFALRKELVELEKRQ